MNAALFIDGKCPTGEVPANIAIEQFKDLRKRGGDGATRIEVWLRGAPDKRHKFKTVSPVRTEAPLPKHSLAKK